MLFRSRNGSGAAIPRYPAAPAATDGSSGPARLANSRNGSKRVKNVITDSSQKFGMVSHEGDSTHWILVTMKGSIKYECVIVNIWILLIFNHLADIALAMSSGANFCRYGQALRSL